MKSASHRDLVWEHRLLWVLMLGILALWGYYYALGRVDRELRGEIVKILATKFPKHRVVLDRAHLEKGQAILLEGLQISLQPRKVAGCSQGAAVGCIGKD